MRLGFYTSCESRDRGVVAMASSSGATFTEARDEWMKEMHEKPKLSMLKLIAECEIKSVNVVSDPDLDWPTAVPEVRKHGNSRASVGAKIFPQNQAR